MSRKICSSKGRIFKVFSILIALVLLMPGRFVLAAPPYNFVNPEEGLLLDKSVAVTGNVNTSGRQIFKVNIKAESSPEVIDIDKPTDIVLLVDTSSATSSTFYDVLPFTSNPGNNWWHTSGWLNSYVYVNGNFYSTRYDYGNGLWYYTISSTRYYVTWDSTNGFDSGQEGSTDVNNPVAKTIYRVGTVTKLDLMKKSINNFLTQLYEYNKVARVAIVEFNGTPNNRTITNDLTGGLVPIQIGTGINTNLTNIVNNIYSTSNSSRHTNSALGHAHDILGTQSNNQSSDKIVILLQAGEPGDNNNLGNSTNRSYAAGGIDQSNQIKAAFSSVVNSQYNFNSRIATNIFGYTHKTIKGNDYVVNGYGLGGKVYSLGIYDSGTVNNDMHNFMSRVSSNYDANNSNVSNSNYFNPTYIYEPYFSTYLDQIAQTTTETKTLGKNYSNLKIKDYVDNRFQIVDQSGNPLDVGDTLNVDGKVGIIKEDSEGIYVEWDISALNPGYVTDGEGYTCGFYIVAKDSFIGGNTVATNIENISGVYNSTNTNIGSLPNPTVNIPFKFNVNDRLEYILLGQKLPEAMPIVQDAMYSPNDASIPADMLTYSFDENFDIETLLSGNKTYELTVTATPKNYIDFSDGAIWTLQSDGSYKKNSGEVYKVPVGTLATTLEKIGDYTVKLITPTFSVKSRTIPYGNGVGVGIKELIDMSITKPTDITNENWIRINNIKDTYWSNVIGSFTCIEETTANVNLDTFVPKEVYKDLDNPLALNVELKINDIVIGSNLKPNVFTIPGTLSISKHTNSTSDQQFIFKVYEGSNLITDVALETGKTVNIGHLKVGSYVVMEDENWSWRYEVDGSNTKTSNVQVTINTQGSNNGVGTYTLNSDDVIFTNNLVGNKWLGDVDTIVNKLVNGTWVGD